MSSNTYMNERIKKMSNLSINQLLTNINNGFTEFWNQYNSKNNNPRSATKKANSSYKPSPRTRAESIARWKEKRKSQTFDKVIRYPSRQRNALVRARRDGKFVKTRTAKKVPNASSRAQTPNTNKSPGSKKI